MTQHYLGGKTIRISAFFQIIVKDSQGVKTLKESKTPQKYLNKKDNFWSKMHSREATTWPTYRKLKRSTYVKKCKSIPTMFTSIILCNLHNDDQNPAMDFPYLCATSLCLCTFSSPPFPTYHIISPPPSLAKLKQWSNTFFLDQLFVYIDLKSLLCFIYNICLFTYMIWTAGCLHLFIISCLFNELFVYISVIINCLF